MTTTTYVLHLNGGPKDDQTIAHWDSGLWVEGTSQPWSFSQPADDVAKPINIRKGCYQARIDSNGDFVPHDLTGAIEADWQGWE